MAKKQNRSAKIFRKTKETQIELKLNLDGGGKADIRTPVPFFNHMLDSFTRHGLFDLSIHAKGDTEIDDHHVVEDVGICLGEAFAKALDKKAGIRRFGWAVLPFDEVLVTAAVDLSGRPALIYKTPLKGGRVGKFEVELVHEFFQAFTNACGLSLHLVVNHGQNRHHIIEAMFKSFGRAMSEATGLDPRVKGIPSTKELVTPTAITIVDYGMGNIHSVAKALEKVGASVSVTSSPQDVARAKRVVLPGVGAFRDCYQNLVRLGLIASVRQAATDGRPFLGICLGLQLLFDESEEFGRQKGLGVIPGKVLRLPEEPHLKIPHMGWNQLEIAAKFRDHPLWQGVTEKAEAYFVHSYYVVPQDDDVVAARCQYGLDFAAAVCSEGIFATQFHPEKSQQVGLQILKNFSNWKP